MSTKKPKAEHLAVCNRYFEQTGSDYWNINDFVKHCRGNNHGKLRGIGTIHNYWWNSIKNVARDGTLKERQRANEILAARKRKNQNAAAAMLINGPTTIGAVNIVSQASDLGTSGIPGISGPSTTTEASSAPPPPTESGYEPSELGLTDAGTEAGTEVGLPPYEVEEEVPEPKPEFTHETELDREFRIVQEKFADSELPDLFYHSIIDVADPLTLARFQQSKLLSKHLHFASLPDPPESFEYATNRFSAASTPLDYRKLVESCPRAPGVEYSQETHVATYVTHCVQTMLCTPRGWMNAPHREGTFDVCVWGPFIDFLFLATPDVTFARKELSALIATNRDRFDGVLRYDDRVIAFDVGIHECSVEATNVANDPKREGDFVKVTTGLADMLQTLAGRLDHRWDLMQKVEVVGILTTGWNITCYRLAFLSPQLYKLTRTRTRRLSFDIDKVSSAFAIMRILVQHKLILERTLSVVLSYEESRV